MTRSVGVNRYVDLVIYVWLEVGEDMNFVNCVLVYTEKLHV